MLKQDLCNINYCLGVCPLKNKPTQKANMRWTIKCTIQCVTDKTKNLLKM